MKLIFDVSDKPKAGQLVVFALQQMLAILAATIAVPLIIGNGLTPAAAMFGAGVGTIVYILFTKRKSPVFLGSSFAFLGSMAAAFAGGVSMQLGMLGLIVGAFLAGLVYVVIAIVVKFVGVGWLNKLMPAVVIATDRCYNRTFPCRKCYRRPRQRRRNKAGNRVCSLHRQRHT